MQKLVGSMLAMVVLAPWTIERFQDHLEKATGVPAQNVALVEDDGKSTKKGSARAFRNSSGQFKFRARLNGRAVPVLVDTGASSVAINESTARKIGIRFSRDDFRHTASTANGEVRYARKTIKELRIEGITVRNVRAAVLQDASLATTLLGMSFLNKLSKFEFEGRTLILYR